MKNTQAQVTIGSGIPPREGLVLDMNADTSSDINMGMGLPAVALTGVKVLTIPGTPLVQKGTLAYNTNKDMQGGVGIGVYNWDGTQWQVVSQSFRLDTVYINANYIEENIREGKYKTLQRAYDVESQKIVNQSSGFAVTFICEAGEIGGINAKGTIPNIAIIGNPSVTMTGRLIFNFSAVRLRGTITNNNIITVNNSFLTMGLAGEPMTINASSINLERGMAVNGSTDLTINLTANLALDYASTIVVAELTTLTAKQLLVRRGSTLEIRKGNIYVSKTVHIQTLSNLSLTDDEAGTGAYLETPAIYAGQNSYISILLARLLGSTPVAGSETYGVYASDNSVVKVKTLVVDGFYSSVFDAVVGGVIFFGATSTGTGVMPNRLATAGTGGMVVHQYGLLNVSVTTIGLLANNGGRIILENTNLNHKITATGVPSSTPSAGIVSMGGNSSIEVRSETGTGRYIFDGFNQAMRVTNGGKIYGNGIINKGTSTLESNYPTATSLGVVLTNGSVIYNTSDQLAPAP